jgi:hypothetical protein
MTEKLFAHVHNETDRLALVALQEKIETLVEENEHQQDQYNRDWKGAPPDWTEVNQYRDAKEKLLKPYEHLMPDIPDPIDQID